MRIWTDSLVQTATLLSPNTPAQYYHVATPVLQSTLEPQSFLSRSRWWDNSKARASNACGVEGPVAVRIGGAEAEARRECDGPCTPYIPRRKNRAVFCLFNDVCEKMNERAYGGRE